VAVATCPAGDEQRGAEDRVGADLSKRIRAPDPRRLASDLALQRMTAPRDPLPHLSTAVACFHALCLPGPVPFPQHVSGVQSLQPQAAMFALCGFVRAAPLAFVNNQVGNSAAPDGGGPSRFMTGLHYASEVADGQAGADGRPSTPLRNAQGVRSAPQGLGALTAWPRGHASGSAGASPQTRGAIDGNLGHHASAMVLASSYGRGGGSGGASASAAARLSTLVNAPGAACASAYDNGSSGAAAFGSAAEHQAAWPAAEQDTGSSAHAPLSGPHFHFRLTVPPGVPAASSFVRRGPVDDDDGEEVGHGDEEHTPQGSRGLATPRPMTGVLSTLPMHKKQRGAATTRCSPPTSSLTRRGGPPGAGGAAAGTGAAVAAGACASVGGGPSQQPRVGSSAGSGARLPEIGAVSPRTRGTTAAASGATPPARAGGASSTAAPDGSSSAGLVTVAHVNDIMRTTGVGLAGVRREITTQRKEVAIMNSQLRGVTKKVDEIAVLADRLTASLIFQRRALVAMSGDVTTVLSHVAVNGKTLSPPATGSTDGGGGAGAASPWAGDDAQTPVATEEQDAQWVLDLKVRFVSIGTSSGTASGPRCAQGCARSGSSCAC